MGDLTNDILIQIHEQQLRSAEALGRIEADIRALAGPEGRVTKLERAGTRNFWISTAVAPALALAHGLARKFGVNV